MLFVGSLLLAKTPAATYAPVTEEELARCSDAVFTGRVLGGRTVERADGALETRFVVETGEVLKGRLPRKVVVTVPGGRSGNAVDWSSLSLPLRRGENRLFCVTRRADGEIVAAGGPDAAELMRDGRPGSPWSRRVARLAERCRAQGDPGSDWTGLAPPAEDLAAEEPLPEIPVDVFFRSVTESGLNEYTVPAGSSAHPTRLLAPDRGEPIPYLVDMDVLPEGISGEEALEAVEEACAEWTAATGIAFQFEGVTSFGQAASTVTTADGRIRVQLHDEYDSIPGSTTLAFGGLRLVNGGLPEGGAGGRVYEREFHRTTQGHVVVNHRHAALSDLKSLEEVLCHELGHALGLAHSSETPGEADPVRKDALMYYLAHRDGRGADLRAYDLETAGRSYPFDNKPPFAPNRVMDITTHPAQSTLGNPEVNRISLLGLDLESPGPPLSVALHPTRTTSNNGDFTLAGSALTYLATGYFDSPRLDLKGTTFYDRAFYRADDGVHASPWATVRVVSFRPDSQPSSVVDGLPDAWISEHFPGDSFTGAFADPDGDQSSTFEEYLTETDPQDAASVLRVSFAAGTQTAASESGVVPVEVTLDRAVLRNVSVSWSVAPESTASPGDYSIHPHSASPLIIPAGETSVVLWIEIAEDDAPEDAETLVLDLGDPAPGVLGALTRMTVTIPEEDIHPEYDFAAAAYSVAEGDATSVLGSIVLQRSVRTNVASSAAVVITGSSAAPAVPGVDVEAGPVLVEFAPGETQRSVPLSIFGDATFEADEQITLTLADFLPAGKAGSLRPSAVLTLLNDDPLPVISWESLTLPESSPAASISLSLSRPSAFPVTFSLRTENGSAIAGEDYEGFSRGFAISPGETAILVPVELLDDGVHEGLETFTLRLSEPLNAVLGTEEAVVTVVDDDPPPLLVFDEAAFTEGQPAAFTASLSGPSGLPASFDYLLLGDSAIAGEDFVAASGQEIVQPGETSIVIPIEIIDDARAEGVELLMLRLENLVNVTTVDPVVPASIADNDPDPVLSVSGLDGREDEGGVEFTLTLSEPSGRPVSLRYQFESGSALADVDFVATQGIAEFAPGQTQWAGSVVYLNDAIYEGEETFLLRLLEPQNAVLSSDTAAGVVRDDEAVPTLTVSSVPALESAGALRFDLVLSHPSAKPIEIEYAIGAGSAGPEDFEAGTGSVLIAPSDLVGSVVMVIVNDVLDEDAETVLLELSSDSEVLLPGAPAQGVILDDDWPPMLSVEGITAGESDGAVRFLVSLSRPSAKPVTFGYRTESGSALAGQDFEERSGETGIPAGETEAAIEIPLIDDELWEGEENFFLVIERADGGEPEELRIEARITDDGPRPGLPALAIELGPDPGDLTISWSGSSDYRIDWSDDLRVWRNVEGVELTSTGDVQRAVFSRPAMPAVFFRLLREAQ